MTSIGERTTTSSKVSVPVKFAVGSCGMGQFGKKDKWYPCIVKKDNNDGTIKVQWTDDMKFTKRLPVEKFCPDNAEPDEPVDNVPMDIFASTGDGIGDY